MTARAAPCAFFLQTPKKTDVISEGDTFIKWQPFYL